MKIIPLYKYERPEGGITVSPVKPEDTQYTEEVRLVADKGKALTKDGTELTICVDTDTSEGWYEVDNPKAEKEQAKTM